MISADRIVGELKKCGITHVAGVPDNISAGLYAALARNGGIRPVRVTREGEAFALAAGLWLGGRTPAVLVQNTGFFESGDSFRGTITRMRVPLLCLVTYRGYAGMKKQGYEPAGGARDAGTLSRPELDSAAVITEATLDAWGLCYDFVHEDGDLAKIFDAFRKAESSRRPYALLFTGGMR